MGNIKQLKDNNFQKEVIDSDKPVLIDFYADWCAPCKVLSPEIDALDKQYGEKIKIYKMNVEKNPQTPNKFGIMSIPNVLFFTKGKIVQQFSGLVSRDKLETKIKELTERSTQ